MNARAKEAVRLVFGTAGCTLLAGISFGLKFNWLGFAWTVCAIAAWVALYRLAGRP